MSGIKEVGHDHIFVAILICLPGAKRNTCSAEAIENCACLGWSNWFCVWCESECRIDLHRWPCALGLKTSAAFLANKRRWATPPTLPHLRHQQGRSCPRRPQRLPLGHEPTRSTPSRRLCEAVVVDSCTPPLSPQSFVSHLARATDTANRTPSPIILPLYVPAKTHHRQPLDPRRHQTARATGDRRTKTTDILAARSSRASRQPTAVCKGCSR